jgi:hypothetical protein
MASSPPPSLLSPLQDELLRAFFRLEQGLFLTEGAALAGFYLGHRTTDDLDLFGMPGTDLDRAVRSLQEAATSVDATLVAKEIHPDFRRFLATRGDEPCVVDLVLDRSPAIDPEKIRFGDVRVDSPREIAANKICALLGRAEIKDLVDLHALLTGERTLESVLEDASRKDASADPATVAWVLSQIRIGPAAALPGGVDVTALLGFRDQSVKRLRAMAFVRACGRVTGSTG